MAPKPKLKPSKPKKDIPSVPLTEDELLEAYTNLLSAVMERPTEIKLHLDRIEITKQLGDLEGLEQAREMMRDSVGLNQQQWFDWIGDKKKLLDPTGSDLEPYMNLLELYQQATLDYLSIPLLISYSQFVITSYYLSQGLTPPPTSTSDSDEEEEEDEEEEGEGEGAKAMQVERRVGEVNPVLETLFGEDQIKVIREEILESASRHLAESLKVWTVWKKFEVDLLKLDNASPSRIDFLNALYVSFLSVPHLGMEQTFSSYSTFISTHLNSSYSTLLPLANITYSPALKIIQDRELQELELRKGGNTIEGYLKYVEWEREVRKVDQGRVEGVLERALAVEEKGEGEREGKRSREVWEVYVDFAKSLPKAKQSTLLDRILPRALKARPFDSILWSISLRNAEKNQLPNENVEAMFLSAIGSKAMDDSVEDLVGVYESFAGYLRRDVEGSVVDGEVMEPELVDGVVALLQDGMEAVNKATKGKGDPQLRLEKNLVRQLERFGRIDEARIVWQNLAEERSRSYMVWYLCADFETRHGTPTSAHEVYVKGCSAKHLDYPEYLLESWVQFEKQNGTLSDLEYCLGRYKKQMKGLEAMRARQAAQAQPQQQQQQYQAASVDPPQVMEAAPNNEKKRDRSPAPETEGAEASSAKKKARVHEPEPEAAPAPAPATSTSTSAPTPTTAPAPAAPADNSFTRDRENSTVFVIGDKAAEMSEEVLKKFFKECGEIRELKHKTMGEKDYAMVEFMNKESVLAAQTRDKKRINDVEVDVHVAWKSCLYVTNYPESYDKDAVTKLFSEYGTIFDNRWPSKRFKTNRRFCYVQFTTPADAEAALVLHGKELEPGQKLIVYISDPGRKKDRTDVGANNKELYVSGLSKHVEEQHLRRLFEPFGTIKGLRIVKNEEGLCKGFAFIDYEEESAAQAALSLHNHEYKKRHMSVTIAQSRGSGLQKPQEGPKPIKSEIEGRRVRVRNIPAGTEEAIVQQAFEKVVPVKLVTMIAGSTDAIVEFETPADQGKVLMQTNDIVIDGSQVDIYPDGAQARTAEGKKPTPSSSNAPLLPRQATRSRGRVGLGFGARGRGRGGLGIGGSASATVRPPPETATGTMAPPASAKSQDDFRAMLLKK